MRTRFAGALLILTVAGPLRAQAVVDPGMTKAQVVASLGKPAAERTSGNSAYLFYPNGSEKSVGMSDVILLQDDKVVDAVFRSSKRRYSGSSSSPSPIAADVARKHPPIAGALSAAPAATPASKTAPAMGIKRVPAKQAEEAQRATPIPAPKSALRDAEKKVNEKPAAPTTAPEAKSPPKAGSKADSAKKP